MKKVTKILVPIDFSDCAENALTFAIQLADKIKANLILLNVPHFDGGDRENFAFVIEEIEKRTKRARKLINQSIQKVIEKVGPFLDETPSIQTNIEMGDVEATICNEALKNQVDYIVMGTQGENSTLDKYLGSTASNVLKNAPCPVMIIPEKAEFEKELVIGYATDFSDADPFKIWKVTNLFSSFQFKLKCVHFNEHQVNNEAKIKELERYFAETVPQLDIELFSLPVKDKVKDMNNFAQDQNINMLVMYKPIRGFFESIFHQSYTQKMVKHTIIPLVVFKENT